MEAGKERGSLLPTAILALLGAQGPLSRTEIARRLQVSPASVTQATKPLMAQGLIHDHDRSPSRGGRPALRLRLVRSAGSVIGVKVTADHVAIAHVELDGTVTSWVSRAYDPSRPSASDELADLLRAAADEHEGHLLGIGVAVPGAVDTQASGVVTAPTLGWREVRIGPMLRQRLGLPVLVENDVTALAVAERLYGVGQEHPSFLLVTIGRGIGAGIVVDGEIFRGSSGGAGEIGHIPVTDDGPPCGCGSAGCLEAYAGHAGLVRTARERGVIGRRSGLARLLEAARAGRDDALDVYRQAGELLGRSLAGIANTLDPELVVISGEGVDAWPYLRTSCEDALVKRRFHSHRNLSIVVKEWDDARWAQGAAALVCATPFDVSGAAGEQGEMVRARMSSQAGSEPS